MLNEISLSNRAEWEATVKSFENYDTFYSWAHAKAFSMSEAGEPILFYYEGEDGRAMNVCIRRDVADDAHFCGKLEKGKFFDLITPYGYGGFWADGPVPRGAVKEYEEYCRNNGYICEFVRFSLFTDYKDCFGGEVESRTHNIIRSLDLAEEELLYDYEHKVRKNIRKARENGLTVICDDGEQLDDFLKIYYSTMERTGAEEVFMFPKEFFETLADGNKVKYFHVVHEDKIISTELVIYGTEYAYSFLGGTDSEFFSLRPNDLLKHAIILWGAETGLKYFVLGGGYGEDDGIFRYKKSFAPDGIVEFYIGRKIFDNDTYDKLVEMRSSDTQFDSESKFFPLYRS